MKSRNLKKIIGIIYFIIAVVIFLSVRKIFPPPLHRLIICYDFAFLGIAIRAFLYYGIVKNGEDKILKGREMRKCVFDYLLYGMISIPLCSFIYLISYEHFKNMDPVLFYLISGSLFTYFGFAITEVAKHFFLLG